MDIIRRVARVSSFLLVLGMVSLYNISYIPTEIEEPVEIDKFETYSSKEMHEKVKVEDELVQEIEEIEEEIDPYEYVEMDLLYSTDTKTYMDLRMITDTTSRQYQFIHYSDVVHVDEKGYLRDDEGFYGVALGSYFGEIGSRYIFTLDTGKELKVVKVESKADEHTTNGFIAHDGSIIEFVIDTQTQYMRDHVYPNGYIFSGNFNNNKKFRGKITKITKILRR